MIVTNKAVKQFRTLCRCFTYRSRNALDTRGAGAPLAEPFKGPTPMVSPQITSYPRTIYKQKSAYVQAKETYEDAGRLITPKLIKLREQEIHDKWRERITAAHERINALLSNKNNATIGEIRKIQPMTAVPSDKKRERKSRS